MKSCSLIAPAKINLYLEILGNHLNGYHELAMIMQSVELADRIDIVANGTEQINLHCEHPQVPSDHTNLAYKAASLMQTKYPDAFAKYGGVDITIDKRIPVAAGLAGGSTDGAAILVGINLMWELGLTQPDLHTLAAELGSDVPFCISGGTAIATGRGEKLDNINSLANLAVVLAKYRNLSVSTAWAYNTYRQQFGSTYLSDAKSMESRVFEVHSGPLVSAVVHQDQQQIGQLLYNDLEKVVLPEFPQVAELRAAFAATDSVLGTMMSGSGPTVFALCESKTQAEQVQQQVRAAITDPELEFWVTGLSSAGIRLLND